MVVPNLKQSRGCLGCFPKPPSPIIVIDEPSKGPRTQGQLLKKSSFSEDLWSTSTIEIENGAFQSQRSIPLFSASNHAPDPHSTCSTSTSNPHEFVNHGLLLWNHTRQQWLANKTTQNKTPIREPRIRQIKMLGFLVICDDCCWNATYESLIGTSKPFPKPIPLSEMVDFLVDIWEQEGLYD